MKDYRNTSVLHGAFSDKYIPDIDGFTDEPVLM